MIDPVVLPDIFRSDHAAFIEAGYPGLMATDTANFRNPNYHQPTDTPATIDAAFLEASTRAALAGLVTYASVDNDQDGTADVCQDQPPPVGTDLARSGTDRPGGAWRSAGEARSGLDVVRSRSHDSQSVLDACLHLDGPLGRLLPT